MTVGELREELNYMVEDGELTDDVEIRMAQQPAWAFEYDLKSAINIVETEDPYGGAKPIKTVYLEEGTQLGYLPDNVRDEIGW